MKTLRFSFSALLLTLAAVVFTAMAPTPEGEGYKVGDVASDFKLKSTSGEMVSLSSMKDAKGFIVVFTCNHCPYVKLYEDRIEALNKEFAGKGYPVVAINPNDAETYPSDDFEHMVERAEEKGFTFPYLRDADQSVAKTYGAKKTPEVFVLQNEGGKYVVRYIGAIDDNPKDEEGANTHYVADAVNSLLAGKDVNPSQTKAVGCSIKWAKN